MPSVAVIFTGGTISSVADAAAGGNIPTLSGEELVARVPGLDRVADLEVIDLGRTPASHFRMADLAAIASRVDEALSSGADGAVVVQGTDTMEESSFAFDLLVQADRPVIVTGAMRAASDDGFDGPANLRAAVRAAASPLLAGQGAIVAMDGELHAADAVVKTHTSAYGTFRSPELGPLGSATGAGVRLGRRRGPRRRLATLVTAPSERVHLVTAVVGMDGTIIDALVAAGADGLVVAGTGAGNTSSALLEAAERAMARGLPVALTTRCVAGRAAAAYAFPGGGATWFRAGALATGSLGGPKARVALAMGLGAGLDRGGLATLLADPAEAS